MSKIKSELSKKNEYFIERHRYYELKHFCLQYPMWKKAMNGLIGLQSRPDSSDIFVRSGVKGDPTAKCAIAIDYYEHRIRLIEDAARSTDESLKDYLIEAVTEGLSYDTLAMRHILPCCRETYYSAYRRFFWILNKIRE